MSDNDKEIFEALSLTYSDEKEDSVDEKNEDQKPSEEKKENSEQTAEKLNGFISETDEILKEKGLENPEKEKNDLRLQEVDDLPVLDLE